MDEEDDEIMEEARRTIFNPEFLMAVALEKVNHPTMFVSSWDDEGGVEPQPDIENDLNARILWAAENGRLDVVKEVLQENPSLVQARDNDLYTPLHRAAYNNHADVVQFLLENGADVAAKTEDGWQPLHSAARWGSLDAARCLIHLGNADINALTNGHLTPLHLAASGENGVQVAELLLSHPNIDKSIVSKAGETAYDVARQTSAALMNLFTVGDGVVDERDIKIDEV